MGSFARFWFLSPDTLFASTSAGSFRSLDGGLSFQGTSSDPNPGRDLVRFPPGSPFAGRIMASSPFGIRRSDDGGDTWTYLDTLAGSEGEAGMYAFASGRLVRLGRKGCTFSLDGGLTLQTCPGFYRENIGIWLDTSEHLPDFEAPEGEALGLGRIVVSGYLADAVGDPLWTSDDEGVTWVQRPRPPTEETIRHSARLPQAGPGSMVLVTNYGEVWQTDDGAKTWTFRGRTPVGGYVNGSTSNITSVEVGPDGRLYLGHVSTGVQNGGLWRTVDPVGPVAPTSSSGGPGVSGPGASLRVWPNPSSGGAVRVSVSSGASVSGVVSVLDVSGGGVAVAAGVPSEVVVETAGLAPGVYVVRLESAAASATARFTVTR